MNNIEIADLLRSASAAYEIKGGNRFKIMAYDRAADAVEHLSSEAKDIWDEGPKELEKVSGIGPSIAKHLDEIFTTGKSKHFDDLFEDLSPAIFELLKVTGIGPKNAKKFVDEFNLKSAKTATKDLLKYANAGRIAEMEGFGEDSEKKVIEAIGEYHKKPKKRMLINKAEEVSQSLIDWMKSCKDVDEISTLGSLRRKASTVGDIDLAAASKKPDSVIEHFINFPNKSRVLQQGPRKAALILPGNIQADLMVESPKNFGSMKQHFTGSKQHNIQLREYAIKKGWKVSDYGITQKGKLNYHRTEKSFYNSLGFDWIPPEMREGLNELELAQGNKLPELIELKDIKGDIHIHSNFDIETSHDIGDNSMKEILKRAGEFKYEYIAFTEHNPSQKNHNQKQVKSLLNKKKTKITQLRNELVKTSVKRVYNSLEIDILPNGDLPVSEAAMQELDFALVSIHSSFKKSRDEQTKRVLKALAHPKVKIFAHPTGRKLNEREGIELKWDEIFKFCVNNNKFLEINASPERLDLADFLIRDAISAGVKLIISTDTHNLDHLDNMKYGVYNARRGWAESKNILNTLSFKDFDEQIKS